MTTSYTDRERGPSTPVDSHRQHQPGARSMPSRSECHLCGRRHDVPTTGHRPRAPVFEVIYRMAALGAHELVVRPIGVLTALACFARARTRTGHTTSWQADGPTWRTEALAILPTTGRERAGD